MPEESPDRLATGDDTVDAALDALPAVPSAQDGVDLDLEEHITQVTEVHRQLQQRLSDLSQ